MIKLRGRVSETCIGWPTGLLVSRPTSRHWGWAPHLCRCVLECLLIRIGKDLLTELLPYTATSLPYRTGSVLYTIINLLSSCHIRLHSALPSSPRSASPPSLPPSLWLRRWTRARVETGPVGRGSICASPPAIFRLLWPDLTLRLVPWLSCAVQSLSTWSLRASLRDRAAIPPSPAIC